MAHIFKMTEWQSGSGNRWYCNDVEDLGNNSGAWWHPANILGLTPAQFALELLNTYKVDYISYNNDVLIYYWKSQAAMRKFKNYVNAQARKKSYMV